jgi:hypothetical protein
LDLAAATFIFTVPAREFANKSGWGSRMPLQRLLSNEPFDPDDIARLTSAYEAALQLLRLTDRNEPVAEIIAAKIIVVYRTGVHDPAHVCARAIKELGIPIPD